MSQGRVVDVINAEMVRQFRDAVEQEFGDTLHILVCDIASLFTGLLAGTKIVRTLTELNFSDVDNWQATFASRDTNADQ